MTRKPSTVSLLSLDDPSLYINRELSLLEFNRRVLEQAQNESTPLLERLKFLCISSSNLDEFFEIRFAGLRQQQAFGVSQPRPDGLSVSEQIKRISTVVADLVESQYRVLNSSLLPELETQGIRFLDQDEWDTRQAQWVKRYFTRELSPILSPIALDPAHPFPQVLNKGLNFIVTLQGKDAFGRNSGRSIVQAPRSLPRVVRMPESVVEGPDNFVLLSSIIEAHASDLFAGMTATGCYAFRVTRNSDLFVDEEAVDDLLQALEGELPSRNYGHAVRMEISDDTTPEIQEFLMDKFGLTEGDVYRCKGPVNLNRLVALPDLVERPDLKYAPFVPHLTEGLLTPMTGTAEAEDGVPRTFGDIFEAIKENDILMHHPFESFQPVVEVLRLVPTPYRATGLTLPAALGEGRSSRAQVMLAEQPWPIGLALCCKPSEDCAIAGYLDEADAILVHRKDCGLYQNAAKNHPLRVVRLDWQKHAGREGVRIAVRGRNRDGLLRDIVQIMNHAGVSLVGTQAQLDGASAAAMAEVDVLLDCETLSLPRLLETLGRLLLIPDVLRATRLE